MTELHRYGKDGPRCSGGVVVVFLVVVLATVGAFAAMSVSDGGSAARITYLDMKHPWERQAAGRQLLTSAAAPAEEAVSSQ